MMHGKKQILFALVVILLTSLACSLPFGNNAPSPEEISATAEAAVSATLTALAPPVLPPAENPTQEPDTQPIPEADPTPIIKTSPDQLRMVIIDSVNNLSSWQEESGLNLLLNTGDVTKAVLSPDGEWIVYTRSATDGVDISMWAIRFDGSDQKLLVSHADFMAMSVNPEVIDVYEIVTISPNMLDFIPGTHTIAFNTYPRFNAPGLLLNNDMWFINLDTAEKRSFLSQGQAGNFYFSPDGTQMALVTPDRIDLLNTDGSNRRIGVLTYPFVYTYSEYTYHANPIWSQDSSYLRVSIPPQDPLGDASAPVNIYHLPIDGSPATLLASLLVAPLENAFLAPDLHHYAFKEQLGEPAENLFSLKFSDLSGGTPIEFTTGSLGFGAWAPDSSHFYFINWNPREIFIGQVGAPGVIALDVSTVMNFSWITSDQFVFIYQSGINYQLRMGTLSTPSIEIANLGSGLSNPIYDFVSP
jgi:hypothetical protein